MRRAVKTSRPLLCLLAPIGAALARERAAAHIVSSVGPQPSPKGPFECFTGHTMH
jgi:hypothetical protein